MSKIAIIVTTMLRDDLLRQSVASMEKYAPENCSIFIGDQGCQNPKDHLPKIAEYHRDRVYYYALPFDCGLSHARNFLVEQAHILGFDYCLIASDSMIFNEYTSTLNCVLSYLLGGDFDLIGFHLKGPAIYWVGCIDMVPGKCFLLDFIDRSKPPDIGPIFQCEIVHNFFVAKTETLRAVKWDDKLKLAEHEDFFYRYKQAGYKVGWTHAVSCDKIKTRSGQHGHIRQANWIQGLKTLSKKWNMRSWIDYRNRQYGFFGTST